MLNDTRCDVCHPHQVPCVVQNPIILWTATFITALSIPTRAADDARQFEDRVRPLLNEYCVKCHSGDQPKGNLRLDNLSLELADARTREHWMHVLERLQDETMPPQQLPRPSAKQIRVLAGWLQPRVTDAEATPRAAHGRVVLRRLNRTEYENTINDLLGIKASLKDQLPADGAADGFDNASAVLHTSSFLMEKYLESADTALNLAITNRPQPPPLLRK